MMRCPCQTLLACLSIDLYIVYLFWTTYRIFFKIKKILKINLIVVLELHELSDISFTF